MPATPRPAASVILLRRGGRHADRALELLLVKRSRASSFMPGVWVFPGGRVEESDGEAQDGFRAAAVRELAEEAAIELGPGDELVPFARWITPEVVPVRFDTWFYLALAPAHTPPEADGHEVEEAAWFEPAAALEAHARDELDLVFPTIKMLEQLRAHTTSEEAIAAARDREIVPVQPRVVGEGDKRRIVVPGESGYEEGREPDWSKEP